MKRIVFLHPNGIAQIMGTDEGFPELPVTAGEFVAMGRLVPFASLVRVTERVAYYREPLVPGSYNFDPRQQ